MGMATLTITPERVKGGGLRLEVEGKVRRGRWGGSRAVDSAAKYLGVDSDFLQSCIDSGMGLYTIPTPAVEVVQPDPPLPVYMRGLTEVAGTGLEFVDFATALTCKDSTIAEPLLYWDDATRLCAVDADFHTFAYEDRPTPERLATRFASIEPAPRWVWVTHGRGLRLIYERLNGYDADELAAVASARITQLEPLATVEIKCATRHPAYPNASGRLCSPVSERVPTTDCSAVSGWYGGHRSVNPEAVQEWLEGHGFEIGGRYEHDRCPVSAGPTNGTPVVIYENGVYCHWCSAHEVRRGTKAAGWFPFEVFVGDPHTSIISRCVEGFTHWEHARFILHAHHDLSEEILRGAYSAMLKSRHGCSDPRLRAVFSAGRDVIRLNQRWGTLKGETYGNNHVSPILERLPSCQYVDEKQKVRVDTEKLARFLHPMSLENYGYPHLRPVWGMSIYGHHNTPRYPYEIPIFKGPGRPPKYIPSKQRGSEEEAWVTLQEAFPGVSRPTIQLLLAAKGCAEADGTWAPFMFISGPTKSSKTTSVIVAAAIAGDHVHSVPVISDDQRIRAAISEAKERGTYCVFNEAVKDGVRRGVQKGEQMEFALSLEQNSISHKMYVGPVEMGTLPVLVWTDVWLPQEVKQHAQLARRIIHVTLPSQVDWHTSMRETGMGKAEWLRTGDAKYVDAADTILSCVIDRFFRVPATFEEIAKELGFYTLADSPEAKAQAEERRNFYELVGGSASIDLNSSSAVCQVWKELADSPHYTSSQRCSEADFQHLLGTPYPISFSVRAIRGRVNVKFTGGESGSLRGSRESIPSGPEAGGGTEVHLPPFDTPDDAGGEVQGPDLPLVATSAD